VRVLDGTHAKSIGPLGVTRARTEDNLGARVGTSSALSTSSPTRPRTEGSLGARVGTFELASA